MWNQADGDSLVIVADAILLSIKFDTPTDTQSSLDCFLQRVQMPSSSSDPKLAIEEIQAIIDECFPAIQPE